MKGCVDVRKSCARLKRLMLGRMGGEIPGWKWMTIVVTVVEAEVGTETGDAMAIDVEMIEKTGDILESRMRGIAR